MAVAAALTGLLMSLIHGPGSTESTRPGTDDTNRSADGPVNLGQRVTDYTSRFGEDSGYRRPGSRDRRIVAQGVAQLLDGQRAQAEKTLGDVDFTIRTLTDSVSGRRYAEISDRSEDSPAPRGWGRVYVDLTTPARWSVQVPHPVADQRTEDLGVRVLRGTPGGVLVVAGAHRRAGNGDAADVAHRTDSVFDAICAELTERGLPAIQLHGYADDSARGYDVIASAGSGAQAQREGRTLADALRARDFAVCRAWTRDCPLEGRSNVQGRKAEKEDVPFLHVEFSNSVRRSTEDATRAVEAINTVIADWSEGRTQE
ncbi:hypothetical protein ABZ532_19885 [Streptomyces sp. NPDC019396]|uniref:hypothetical protein n=1 Tax=Streptomyces sp. NPDC019396 TaxID=3154687 RepID=UPI0033D5EF66